MSTKPDSSKATIRTKDEQKLRSVATAPNAKNSANDVEHIPKWKTLCLVVVMAICSTAAQLPLTPSHGSIPSIEYHLIMFQTCCILYLAWRMMYVGGPPIPLYIQRIAIPVLPACTPLIQFYLAPTARYMGPSYSAALINGITLFPLQGLLISSIRASFERWRPDGLGLEGLLACMAASKLWTMYQAQILEPFYGLIRPYLMTLISLVLTMLLPTSRWVRIAVLLPILHTLFLNPHSMAFVPVERLNNNMKPHSFSVVARTEGLTGYLSVIENIEMGYRLMRCDHSLLGGSWIAGKGSWPGGANSKAKPGRVAEPAFAVFVMLEAVRLVELKGDTSNSHVPDSQASALNIGLGVGTTPAAFIAHGIDTTIVELDPVVHDLATTYFDLPSNHTSIIEDAAAFLSNAIHDPQVKQYDYIIHDVFTGGAEPTELFTYEFISNLKEVLKPDGTIAINYAVDLDLPSAKLVVNTVFSIFPNCRLFRDLPEEDGSKHVNFVNMIMFCRKTKTPFGFREPVEADYLGTSTRKTYLLPKLEMDLDLFLTRDSKNALVIDEKLIMYSNRTGELEKWHSTAAKRHWEVMRSVVPDEVWELW